MREPPASAGSRPPCPQPQGGGGSLLVRGGGGGGAADDGCRRQPAPAGEWRAATAGAQERGQGRKRGGQGRALHLRLAGSLYVQVRELRERLGRVRAFGLATPDCVRGPPRRRTSRRRRRLAGPSWTRPVRAGRWAAGARAGRLTPGPEWKGNLRGCSAAGTCRLWSASRPGSSTTQSWMQKPQAPTSRRGGRLQLRATTTRMKAPPGRDLELKTGVRPADAPRTRSAALSLDASQLRSPAPCVCSPSPRQLPFIHSLTQFTRRY